MHSNDKDPLDVVAYNTLDAKDERITTDLQFALDDRKDLVLCPGTFYLTKTLVVRFPNQVILGLGLSTLIAPQDEPGKGDPGDPKNPGTLIDIFARVGGVNLERDK
eukprot:8771835-Ditylum_brightwellii.AAC.1